MLARSARRVVMIAGLRKPARARGALLRFAIPGIAALGPITVAELSFTYVETPSLTTYTVTVPVAVNVVPGDQAAKRIACGRIRPTLHHLRT